MRLPWKRKETDVADLTAQEARRRSEAELAKARDRWPEVHEVAGSLRFHRQRNHFAEMIAETFKETR